MKLSDFDYDLPPELIAQEPLKERTASRLLSVDGGSGTLNDQSFSDIYNFIQTDDLLIFNNTKVIPARLHGEKETGGKVETLVERLLDEHSLLAHIKSSRSPKPGSILLLENSIQAEVLGRQDALFKLRLLGDIPALELLEQYGHMPLPPYIERSDREGDKERYQTVFAEKPGAVAAPTAGLHFDESLLQKIRNKGVETAEVTLHVGAGTFQPVRVDDLSEHVMHSEYIEVSEKTCEAVERCKKRGGRVIAIGTTTVRSLEAAAKSGKLEPFVGDTQLFITPGYVFNVVDVMVTNFHLPKSTLLMLVSAFAGYGNIMVAYRHAVKEAYRFFSYGDAMILTRKMA